jgi:hypothetical protein
MKLHEGVSAMKLLFWLPRIGGILIAVFISIFAMDIFNEQTAFWNTALALGVHLIPSAILIVVVLVAWKWEWVGSIAYMALAILYIITAWGRFPFSVYLIIAGPLLLNGLLFLLSWKYRFSKPDANGPPSG